MTVLTEQSSTSAIGDASTFDFPATFTFLNEADLTVKLNGVTKALNVDYNISGSGPAGTAVVTFYTEPGAGVTVLLERNTPELQEVDLRPNGLYEPDTIETMVDRLTLIVQELNRRLAVVEALAGNFVTAAYTGAFVELDFTTNANSVEATFPLNVAVTNGYTARNAWCTYLLNKDAPAEVFDEPPAIQWQPPIGGNTITLMRVAGLKPATNYRIRLLVTQ